MPKNKSAWWNDFFPLFRPIFSTLPVKLTNAEASYTIKKLGLKSGSKFLDCPCGIGRISIPLARKGIRVTGVDITKSYLDELASKSRQLNLKISLIRSDMRKIKFDSVFDAVGNLWTSFGYFEKDSDNLLVLKKFYRALKPGGKFLLHIINRDWIIKNYTSGSLIEIGGIKALEERYLDYRKSINYSIWHFFDNGKETNIRSHLRMYSFHELHNMIRQVGFIDIEGYGSMDDEPISRDNQMMYIIGRKPK
jgi:ubiquinone/menaquinone biosynthesis C-methylase UbiE